MRWEPRGEEWLVSCCGDIVGVGEGDGGSFGEGRKSEKKSGTEGRLGCEIANASKGIGHLYTDGVRQIEGGLQAASVMFVL